MNPLYTLVCITDVNGFVFEPDLPFLLRFAPRLVTLVPIDPDYHNYYETTDYVESVFNEPLASIKYSVTAMGIEGVTQCEYLHRFKTDTSISFDGQYLSFPCVTRMYKVIKPFKSIPKIFFPQLVS